jgi:hypothetical protein
LLAEHLGHRLEVVHDRGLGHLQAQPRGVGARVRQRPRDDVDEVDRLARVQLSCTIEPGDLRVAGLVSELGAGKVLGYLEAAADADAH